MSRASAALALFDALFDHLPRQLASAFNHRGVPPRQDWDITELALALSSDAALWTHLSQLHVDELDFLSSLPQSSNSPEAESAANALLAARHNGEVFLYPEVSALLTRRAHSSEPSSIASAPGKGPDVQTDVPGVFGHIEHIESLLEHSLRHRVEATKL